MNLDISTRAHPNTFAIVDEDDFERANKYKWRLADGTGGFVIRELSPEDDAQGRRFIFLHKWLLGTREGVGHINEDRLDNRKANLRMCTRAQLLRNRPGWGASKLKGAVKQRDKWKARIMVDGKAIHLGIFNTAEEAHQCYCLAAKRLHGEFANTRTKVPQELNAST